LGNYKIGTHINLLFQVIEVGFKIWCFKVFFGITSYTYTETGFEVFITMLMQVNTVVHVHHLLQQICSIMMSVGRRYKGGIAAPRIGLLSIGEEATKGNELTREAHRLLKAAPLTFIGNVEARDLYSGQADVIVCDGFTGNVALKTIEGTAKLYTGFLRESFRTSIMAKVGYLLARPAINSLRTRVDPRRYNGAIFLGLNGIAVKSHGGTDAIGFANAIGVAVDMVVHGAIEKIKEDFARLTTPPLPDVKAASL